MVGEPEVAINGLVGDRRIISSKPTSGSRCCEHVRRHNFRLSRHPIAISGERQFHLEFRGLEDISLFTSKPLLRHCTIQTRPPSLLRARDGARYAQVFHRSGRNGSMLRRGLRAAASSQSEKRKSDLREASRRGSGSRRDLSARYGGNG